MRNLNKKNKFDLALPWVLWLSLGLFIAGLFTPFMAVKSFWVFHEQTTLLTALGALFKAHDLGVLAIVVMFSLVFPFVKLVLMLVMWYRGNASHAMNQKLVHLSSTLGKWSMLDVFVVANLVVAVRLGIIAEMRVSYGAYLFAASIVLTLLVSYRLHNLMVSSVSQN